MKFQELVRLLEDSTDEVRCITVVVYGGVLVEYVSSPLIANSYEEACEALIKGMIDDLEENIKDGDEDGVLDDYRDIAEEHVHVNWDKYCTITEDFESETVTHVIPETTGWYRRIVDIGDRLRMDDIKGLAHFMRTGEGDYNDGVSPENRKGVNDLSEMF